MSYWTDLEVTNPLVEVHVSVHLLGEHALAFANLHCPELAVEVSTPALLWIVCGAALTIGSPRVVPDCGLEVSVLTI